MLLQTTVVILADDSTLLNFNFQWSAAYLVTSHLHRWVCILFLSVVHWAIREGVNRNHLLSRSLGSGRDVGWVEWIRLATAHRGTIDHRRNRSRQTRKSYCATNEHYPGIRIDSNLRSRIVPRICYVIAAKTILTMISIAGEDKRWAQRKYQLYFLKGNLTHMKMYAM